jgi:hypothetical protein
MDSSKQAGVTVEVDKNKADEGNKKILKELKKEKALKEVARKEGERRGCMMSDWSQIVGTLALELSGKFWWSWKQVAALLA